MQPPKLLGVSLICGLVQVAEEAISFSVGNSFELKRFTFQRSHISISSAFLWEGAGAAPSHSCISMAVGVWLDQLLTQLSVWPHGCPCWHVGRAKDGW